MYTKGIGYLIDKKYFNESACIHKFYNHKEDKYYDVNEPNFRWPNLSHGNFIPNKLFIVLLWKNVRKILYK